MLRAVHDHARQHGRERRPALDPEGPGRLDLRPGVDDQRLHALLRGAAGDRRPARRHLRPPADVPRRRRHLRPLLGDRRPRPERDRAGPQPRGPGRRRGADDAGDALDHHRRLPRPRARQGDGHLGRRLGPGAGGRPGARRLPHRARQLAGDLLHQHPGRDRRRHRDPVRGARVARHLGRARRRLRRRRGADRRPDGARPRPGRGQRLGLGLDRRSSACWRSPRSPCRPSSSSRTGSRRRWSSSTCSATATSSARSWWR